MESESEPSTTDLLDPKNEEGWEDVESDVEDRTFKSLFDDKWFGDITEMLKYDKEKYDFDYVKLKRQLNLDFLDRVQLINYVRSEVQAGNALPKVWTTALFEDEQYLKPTLEDDAVLYSLDDVDESAFGAETPLNDGEQEVQDLRERLAQLQIQFAAYREEVQVSFQKHMNNMKDSPTPEPTRQPEAETTPPKPDITSSQADQDSGYFTSYSYNTIHESMLKDTIRTDAYRDFIYSHKDLFAGKTVLDLGCGTGILSLFCARAGAKLVLAVDNSAIIDKARVISYANGHQDVIRCLRGKIEDVTLPVAKVDIIVSEWMGYGLLYESMLDSVLWARDRYLDPQHGLMVPSHASLRLAPLIASDLRIEHIDFWTSVYGFDMSAMLDGIYDEALVRLVPKSDVPPTTTASAPVLELNLHTASPTDLTFQHPFSLPWPPSRESPANQRRSLDGFVLSFDIFFLPLRSQVLAPGTAATEAKSRGFEAFSTGPAAPETHWQQVVLLVEKQGWGCEGDVVKGTVGYRKKDGEGKGRSVDIEVRWEEPGGKGEGEKGKERRQVWTLD